MDKKISRGLALALSFLVATITFILTMFFSVYAFNGKLAGLQGREKLYNKLAEVDEKVRANFFSADHINEQALSDGMIAGYLQGLDDAYAQFYTAQEYKDLQESNKGNLVGIGIDIVKDENGMMRIADVYENSPGQKAGLEKEDIILQVEGESVQTIGFAAAADRLTGEKGTVANIIVQRGTASHTYKITREKIEIQSVKSALMGEVGYVRIKSFNDKTPKQLEEKMRELRGQGAKRFLFDVRNNGGGLLTSVIEVLEQLLPEGPIGYSIDKDGNREELAKSKGKGMEEPAVVLINQSSASAAELFASAMGDYQKAKLVGTRSFGKGVMQNTFHLSDGSAIRFTIAEYTGPVRPNFNGVGLTPDMEIPLSNEEAATVFANDMEADVQLKKAVEILQNQ